MRCVERKNILLKQNTNLISNHIAYGNSFFFCTQLRDERRISFYWHNHNIVHPHFQELIVRWCIQAASTNDISISFQVFSYSSSFDIKKHYAACNPNRVFAYKPSCISFVHSDTTLLLFIHKMYSTHPNSHISINNDSFFHALFLDWYTMWEFFQETCSSQWMLFFKTHSRIKRILAMLNCFCNRTICFFSMFCFAWHWVAFQSDCVRQIN